MIHQIREWGMTAALALLAGGCTSVTVDPLPAGISDVLIIDNPKVVVPDFVEVMRSSFERHGIATRVVRDEPTDSTAVMVTYSALQSWDFGTYLSQAEVVIRQGGRRIGYAEYHLIGKGGLSLMKWQSVRTKMDPVFDELLANYPRDKQMKRGLSPRSFDSNTGVSATAGPIPCSIRPLAQRSVSCRITPIPRASYNSWDGYQGNSMLPTWLESAWSCRTYQNQ